jgi:hypothetical protein
MAFFPLKLLQNTSNNEIQGIPAYEPPKKA